MKTFLQSVLVGSALTSASFDASASCLAEANALKVFAATLRTEGLKALNLLNSTQR